MQLSAATRRVRQAIVGAAVAGALVVGGGAITSVATAKPLGYVTYDQCNGVSGSFAWNPGLLRRRPGARPRC